MKTDRRFAGYGAYVALFFLTAFFVWFFCLRHGMFGAKVDWISQHSVLPDYFRRQFYETGDLFPEFAANIGGGQNIYNFSYYGLLSPVILPSYLFPFVKMGDYMMAVQFACLAVSVLLLYRWLLGQGFESKICFCVSLLFLLSGPMIFHSYNQIMFVNYMPFLCMGFLGVDRYFEKGYKGKGTGGKKGRKRIKSRQNGLLTVSVFLMIMTSFYFSIGGMLALFLYGIHRYVKERGEIYAASGEGRRPGAQKAEVRKFLGEGFLFLRSFFVAVLMSGVLLIPTAAAMAGRKGRGGGISLSELFLPELSPGVFFYTPYGMGLTAFSFTALVAMLFARRRSERVLAWGCMGVFLIPAVSFLMNGGLYVRNKVMIPFLPLMCYVTACYIREKEAVRRNAEKETSKREKVCGIFMGIMPYAAALCIFGLHFARHGAGRWGRLMLADVVLMLLCYGIYCVKKHVFILLLPPVVFLGIYGNVYHTEAAKYLDRKFYGKVTDRAAEILAEKAAKQENGFYRTEQFGTEDENAANLNRIWNAGQYVSSIYSSLYNSEYQRFRKEFAAGIPYRNLLMQPAAKNPVYCRFMGIKYRIADSSLQEEMALAGYALKGREGTLGLYEDPLASPVAYATDRLMEEREYETLGFPENQLVFLDDAIVEKGNGKKQETSGGRENITPVPVSLPEEINSRKNETIMIEIPPGTDRLGKVTSLERSKGKDERGQVLFLRFRVENLKPSKDIAVWLEGQRNKLTSDRHFYYNDNTMFTYAVPVRKGQRRVKMVFGKGQYRISKIQCFLGKLPVQEEAEKLYQSEFLPDKDKTKGNVIEGGIDVENAGYFITTIPYDSHFEIFVDRKKADVKRVNTAFLGCRIEKGRHKVEMVFHAPGMKAGKAASLIGLFLFCFPFLSFCRDMFSDTW